VGPEAPTRTVVRSLLCPSDRYGDKTETFVNPDTNKEDATWNRSNYLAFFGDRNLGAGLPGAVPPNRRAAFGINGYGAKLVEITNGNGTSNTMIFGEYLKGLSQQEAPNDLRGVHWIDAPGCSQIYTYATPNSALPDLFNPSEVFCPPSYNRPDLNLPCGGGGLNDLTAASRSRHPGGVNVLKADGSVHFISQNIDLATWQAMGSIYGSEILSGK
jgi:prepilin-type processing-associated H-X9-DG protein